jgi:hypothetical protein
MLCYRQERVVDAHGEAQSLLISRGRPVQLSVYLSFHAAIDTGLTSEEKLVVKLKKTYFIWKKSL